ncbi:MAG: ABC transporter substrate-binding protein, partial [Sneathiella sp.]
MQIPKLFTLLTVSFILLFSVSFSAYAKIPEQTKPIRIILNNWTSQIVLSKILGELYKQRGYNIEYVVLETKNQWSHLHRGLEHIQVEVWEGTMASDFNRVLGFGEIIDAGNHNATTREEWWYPEYVEAVCPGLPDWRALKNCAALFATPTSKTLGRYVAGPWEKPERAKIRALNLGFMVDAVENSDDLWVELQKAKEINKPIVLFNWSPNWVEDRYKGKFIEFPSYDTQCEIDPAWGVNKKRTHDCGNPKNGWLKKVAWRGIDANWPCASAILRDLNFTNAMISEVAALVDADGLT